MADVFISYETNSAREIAKEISASLDSIGISCWYASRDMEAGAYYAEQIQREIENCKVFVLVLSKNAMQSNHVFNELHIAMSCFNHGEKVKVIPFRVDDSHLEGRFQYFLDGLHIVNGEAATNGRIQRAKFQELVKQVNSALKKPPIPPPPPPVPKWLYVVIGCAVSILLLLVVARISGWGNINSHEGDGGDSGATEPPPPVDYSIHLYNSSIPSNSLLKGAGFALRGLIRSENCPLSNVTAVIRDNSGNTIMSYNPDWNQREYDIEFDGMNDAFVFGSLNVGSYTFILSASNEYNTNIPLATSNFSIVSWTPPIDIVGENIPTGEIQQGSYDLWGYVISSYPITEISAFIYNDAYPGTVVDGFEYHAHPNRTRYTLFSDGLNNVFVFSNLGPGSYTFRLEATYSTENPIDNHESSKTIARTTHFIVK